MTNLNSATYLLDCVDKNNLVSTNDTEFSAAFIIIDQGRPQHPEIWIWRFKNLPVL